MAGLNALASQREAERNTAQTGAESQASLRRQAESEVQRLLERLAHDRGIHKKTIGELKTAHGKKVASLELLIEQLIAEKEDAQSAVQDRDQEVARPITRNSRLAQRLSEARGHQKPPTVYTPDKRPTATDTSRRKLLRNVAILGLTGAASLGGMAYLANRGGENDRPPIENLPVLTPETPELLEKEAILTTVRGLLPIIQQRGGHTNLQRIAQRLAPYDPKLSVEIAEWLYDEEDEPSGATIAAALALHDTEATQKIAYRTNLNQESSSILDMIDLALDPQNAELARQTLQEFEENRLFSGIGSIAPIVVLHDASGIKRVIENADRSDPNISPWIPDIVAHLIPYDPGFVENLMKEIEKDGQDIYTSNLVAARLAVQFAPYYPDVTEGVLERYIDRYGTNKENMNSLINQIAVSLTSHKPELAKARLEGFSNYPEYQLPFAPGNAEAITKTRDDWQNRGIIYPLFITALIAGFSRAY